MLLVWILFASCVCICYCYTVLSVPCNIVIACWEMADLLALLCVTFSCVYVTLPYGILILVAKNLIWFSFNIENNKTPFLVKQGSFQNLRFNHQVFLLKAFHDFQEECMIVHYNRPIAKQIIQSKTSLYDDIFVCVGPFYILFAYFWPIGALLTNLENLKLLQILRFCWLGQWQTLESMLAQAIHVLHFRAFLKEFGNISTDHISVQELGW